MKDIIIENIEKLYNSNPEMFIETIYYDYNDSLDLNLIDDSLNQEELINKIYDEVFNLNEDYYYENTKYMKENIKEHLNLNNNYDEEEIDEILDDYIYIDYNLDEEYCELGTALHSLMEKYKLLESGFYPIKIHEEDYDEFINRSEILKYLFDSQGYKFSDLSNTEKVSNLKFLKSFIRECQGLSYDKATLTILLKTNAKDFIYNFKDENKKIIIEPDENLNIGFFDSTYGSGSYLEIELEKPLEFDINRCKEYQIEGRDSNYTVNETYGLLKSCWTKNYEFTNREKEQNKSFRVKDDAELER